MANIKNLSNIEQVFYRYELWEDFQSGMYRQRNDILAIQKAMDCLSDATICETYMKKVVSEWKIATQQVLTNPESNGRAWLGQCACFMYGGCHDEETRKAWVLLTPQIQKQANDIADKVILEWMKEYSKQCPNYQMTLFDFLERSNYDTKS